MSATTTSNVSIYPYYSALAELYRKDPLGGSLAAADLAITYDSACTGGRPVGCAFGADPGYCPRTKDLFN
jgi:hypothetical protein